MGSGSRKGLPFILQLPIFLIVALITAVFWLFEKLLDLGRNDSDAETPPDDAKLLPELKRLAEVLARGDPAALDFVMLAAEDQPAFVEKYSGTRRVAGGAALGTLIADLGDDLNAYAVLEEVYASRGLLATIDWRSETDESIGPINVMLQRLGVRDFDWSFIETLLRHGDGTELRNNNFLTIVRDRLQARGLTLAHLDQFGDSYGFAVVSTEDFERIRDIDNQRFAVRADFGPDESYESAKRILAAHHPAG